MGGATRSSGQTVMTYSITIVNIAKFVILNRFFNVMYIYYVL